MNPELEGRAHLAGLIDVMSLAIARGMLDEAEVLLASLRALRPTLVELDTFEAWIELKRGHLAEAMHILGTLEMRAPHWSVGKALMAYCQFASGDPSWQASAQDVVDHGTHPEAIALVRVLIDPDAAAEPVVELVPAAHAARPEPPPRFSLRG